ncbi:MAG TPA: hypothetical protein VMF91_13810 [Bryobacteraceae bacterium]|nr:hypothetical protein [Bryobacteraceae bacterium]
MTLEQSIMKAVRSLPPDKQQELLDRARRLGAESHSTKPFKNVRGLWADLGVSVSAEDIDEVRREMWKGFPRDA